MKTMTKFLIGTAAVIRASLVPAFAMLLSFQSQQLLADVVTDWNTITLTTLTAAGEGRVTRATRALAMVHAAIYDAVNSVEQRYSPYAVTARAPGGTSPEAAAVLAAYTVLVGLYPSQKPALDGALTNSLSAIPSGNSKGQGVAWGTSVGNTILVLRSHDGSTVQATYNQPPAPGVWQPTPPAFAPAILPAWGSVTPFTLRSGSQFRAPAPPSVYNARFRRDFEEVKSLGAGDSAVRTPEQTEIALFWLEGSHITWNHIALTIAERHHHSLLQSARLFALLNFAEADGSITAFDSKYTYNFWRPVTAIQEGVSNGKFSLPPDPSWLPLQPTPAHPDYTSQHALLGSAAATVLEFFFETDHIPFTVTTSFGVPRSFDSFSQAAEENGNSRVYVGFHFRTAVLRGMHQGADVGEWVCDNFLTDHRDDR